MRIPAHWITVATIVLGAPIASPAAPAVSLPLTFEANRGQAPAAYDFISRGPEHTLLLASDTLLLARRWQGAGGAETTLLGMRFVGASCATELRGRELLPGRTSYLTAARSLTDIPTFAAVTYRQLYDAVSLVVYSRDDQLEYDLVVAPGADPAVIDIAFDGADSLVVDDRGDLVIGLGAHALRHLRPYVYQETGGTRREVAARYVVAASGDRVGFAIGDYDRSAELVIDPLYGLAYSTFFGDGDFDERGYAIAADDSGACFVAGTTASANFMTSGGAMQSMLSGSTDAFVAKLDEAGNLIFSTYLGGSGDDEALAIYAKDDGSIVVGGWTASDDFPGTASPLSGPRDGFVAELAADGASIVYATYAGGSGAERVEDVVVDAQGYIYAAGVTNSPDLPLAGEFQAANGGLRDLFVQVYRYETAPPGLWLDGSTYYGGSGDETGGFLALAAPGGAVVLAGTTRSDDLPTVNPLQGMRRGTDDALVARVAFTAGSPGTLGLDYATYLGGDVVEETFGVASDPGGAAYVVGATTSSSFAALTGGPSADAVATGGVDVFVSKLAADGASVVYSQIFGGASDDAGRAITVDDTGAAFLTGHTISSDFPVMNAQQATLGGATDAFVAQLDASGALSQATYLGGAGVDEGFDIARGGGRVWLTGGTESTDFPVSPTAIQPVLRPAAATDVFLTRFQGRGRIEVTIDNTSHQPSEALMALRVRVTNTTGATIIGAEIEVDFPPCIVTTRFAPGVDIDTFGRNFTSDWSSPPTLLVMLTDPLLPGEVWVTDLSSLDAGASPDLACCAVASFRWQADPSDLTATGCYQIEGCGPAGSPQPDPVFGLTAVTSPGRTDVELAWDPPTDVATAGFNVWKVIDGVRRNVGKAHRPGSVAMPSSVTDVCLSVPRATQACSDPMAVVSSPALISYRVRGECADGTEGIEP